MARPRPKHIPKPKKYDPAIADAQTGRTDTEVLVDAFTRWRQDPRVFFSEALGKRISNQQNDLLCLVRDMMVAKAKKSNRSGMSKREHELAGKYGISVHSGKGLGKDFTIAGLTPWLLLCFSPFKGLATAPNMPQLEDVYSSEVKKILRESPARLYDFIEVVRGNIRVKGSDKEGGNFITKRTAVVKGGMNDHAVTIQGLHEKYMVLFGDEASGLPEGLIRAMTETCTGFCNMVILIGNPNFSSGYFYKTHYDTRVRDLWECVRWNAEETDLEDISPGINAHIERQAKYGLDSNVYRITVLGLPPLEEEDALIPLSWIFDAVDREIEVDDDDPVVLGVDVGRGGDASTYLARAGNKVLKVAENKVRDTMLVADWVGLAIEEYNPDVTAVDVIGIGAGVVDKLRLDGYEVREVNFAEAPSGDERFKNLRAQAYWNLRELFENRVISIPNDEQLIYELSTIKVEDFEPKIIIKSKKKMRSEGIASPNRADALAISYFMRSNVASRVAAQKDAYDEAEKMNTGKELSWMVA